MIGNSQWYPRPTQLFALLGTHLQAFFAINAVSALVIDDQTGGPEHVMQR
jgi:hypothetical protein